MPTSVGQITSIGPPETLFCIVNLPRSVVGNPDAIAITVVSTEISLFTILIPLPAVYSEPGVKPVTPETAAITSSCVA